jgi:TM2 domain-containing membrane protein YozV
MSQEQDWNSPSTPSYQPPPGQGYPPPQGQQGFPPAVYQQPYPQGPGYMAPPVMQVMPKNAALAIIISFFIPGVGSIYAGKTTTGVIILICYVVSWILTIILIGFAGVFIFWVWGMIDAFLAAQAWNRAHGIES